MSLRSFVMLWPTNIFFPAKESMANRSRTPSVFDEPDRPVWAAAGYSPQSGPNAPLPSQTALSVRERALQRSDPAYLDDKQRWEVLSTLPIGSQQIPSPIFNTPTSLTMVEWLWVEETQPRMGFDRYMLQRQTPISDDRNGAEQPRPGEELWVNQLEQLDQVKRWWIWKEMTSVGRMLIRELFGSPFAWILRSDDEANPLERAVVEFDRQAMGNRSLVLTLAQGIGMVIPYDLDADLYFVDNYRDYVEIARRIQDGIRPDPENPDLLSDAELASFFGVPDRRLSWGNRAEFLQLVFNANSNYSSSQI
jgi:hypothetical protein